MSFPTLYREIQEMIVNTALQTRMARAICRKAGIRAGSGATLETGGASVLSFTVHQQINLEDIQQTGGMMDNFVWSPMPAEFPWWPENANYGRYETLTDLSDCTLLRNTWYIHPSYAVPDVNIRVQASLDGTTWEYATSDFLNDWRYAGANVNAGQWYTYTPDDVAYQNYPATYPERVGVDNAFPGGLTTSGWHHIGEEFRVEDVHLRWLMDFSSAHDEDPIYTSYQKLIFGHGDVQVC